MRLQFSLFSAMILVACVAVGCVALVRPTYLWASLTWSLTMAILALAIVVALARRGRSRCFWASFALLGWGYLVLTLAPGLDDHTGELLITRPLLDWLGSRLGHAVPDPTMVPGIWTNLPFAQPPAPGSTSPFGYFAYLVSGHCLIALLVGIGGGSLGSLLYDDREERTVSPRA
jgi:hypothetical protein